MELMTELIELEDSGNQKRLEKIINRQYDGALDDPMAWFRSAWKLKRAAQEFGTMSRPGWSNGIPDDPKERELANLMPVYRFLIGQSFENLLKALLVSQGHSAGTGGRLAKSFKIHSLETLAGRLDKTNFPMSNEELETLLDLQPYLDWAGRYPIPTERAQHSIALGFSSTQHYNERRLWERIAATLKTNAPEKKRS